MSKKISKSYHNLSLMAIFLHLFFLNGITDITLADLPKNNYFDYIVTDFGARGDGIQDDTQPIQRALNEAGKKGGGVVFLPSGRYLIKGHLIVPENVTLEGIWRGPFRGEPEKSGSLLLAVSGKGDPNGIPLIRVSTSSILKGFAVFYPEQTKTNPPIPYPWTIQSNGPADDVSLIDLTLINPYQAIDFGTYPTGRHKIRNIHAYPLYRGLYINQCYDVGRLENIHFWPFWDLDPQSPLWEFTKKEGIAFVIGKTDGEMGFNLFSIFYSIGMHFIEGPIYDENRQITKYLPGSGTYTNCYMDISPCAVRVDSAMENAGITFVNSSFMSKVIVDKKNRGPVKFVGCGFWGIPELDSQAVLEGWGSVTFEACHFSGWDKKQSGFPCVYANNRFLMMNSCEFIGDIIQFPIIYIGKKVRAGIITSNLSHGKFEVRNDALKTAQIVIQNNVATPDKNYVKDWLILGPFPNEEIEDNSLEVNRKGFDTDYLIPLGGELNAILHKKIDTSKLVEASKKITMYPISEKKNLSPKVRLHDYFGPQPGIAYAFTYLISKKEQEVLFEMGMNDGGKVIVNGEIVYSRFNKDGMACRPGTDVFQCRVKKGYNPILIKIENRNMSWEYIVEAYPEFEKSISFSYE